MPHGRDLEAELVQFGTCDIRVSFGVIIIVTLVYSDYVCNTLNEATFVVRCV